jgi:hypothetical protein
MVKRNPSLAIEGYKRPLRDQHLVTLDDQGVSRTLPTSLFHFDGRDQTWNSHAESFIDVNRPLLAAIDVEPRLAPTPIEIRLDLRSGGSIGAVPLLAPDTMKIMGGVVIRPRFGWDGVGSVLSRIGWSAAPQVLDMPMVPGSAREIPPWVLAGPVLMRLRKMLDELKRGFQDQEEMRQTPRGQILWQRYVSNELPKGTWHHIPCRFPELTYDLYLRSYVKWGLEQLYSSLAPYITTDAIAGSLAEQTKELLLDIPETPARYPEETVLRSMLRGGLPTKNLSMGVEALRWLVDERGLAGITEQDGLSWALPMSDLFEKWLCYLVSEWAKIVGGSVSVGYRGQTLVPLSWERHTFSSLNSLIPDIVVRVGDHTYIFDAKYKSTPS